MAYATQQNLIDRFGERELILLTDNTVPKTGAINTDVLAKALENAEGEVNGYLSVKYSLPLASPPKLLEGLTCDIARYLLYKDRTITVVEKAYDKAIRLLEKIAAGTIQIGTTSTETAPASTGGPQVSGSDPVFTRDSLKDYTG